MWCKCSCRRHDFPYRDVSLCYERALFILQVCQSRFRPCDKCSRSLFGDSLSEITNVQDDANLDASDFQFIVFSLSQFATGENLKPNKNNKTMSVPVMELTLLENQLKPVLCSCFSSWFLPRTR